MSVAILRDKSFGNVLKSMSSYSLREGSDTVDVAEVLGTGETRTPEGLDRLWDAVRLFVRRAILFNNEAYRLRYPKENVPVAEPVSLEQLSALENMGEVVSRAQLFMTLECIDYNSDVTDYLSEERFKAYPLHDTFLEWQGQLKDMTGRLANVIAYRKAHDENCEWF